MDALAKPGRAVINRHLCLAILTLLLGCAEGRAEDTVYFVVAPGMPVPLAPTNDSCVVPMTQPQDIAEARRLLREVPPQNRPYVSARFQRAADGINRDQVAAGKPRWSWHVTQFARFANVSIGISDGTPTTVENGTGGHWTSPNADVVSLVDHAIVAELTLEQMFFVSNQVGSGGVTVNWLDLGTNYVYTAESSDAISPTNWVPAPGGTWPTNTTNWVDTVALTNQARFYRVKAQLKEQ